MLKTLWVIITKRWIQKFFKERIIFPTSILLEADVTNSLLPVGATWRTFHLELLMSSKLNCLLLQARFSDINKTSIVNRKMRMVARNSLQELRFDRSV